MENHGLALHGFCKLRKQQHPDTTHDTPTTTAHRKGPLVTPQKFICTLNNTSTGGGSAQQEMNVSVCYCTCLTCAQTCANQNPFSGCYTNAHQHKPSTAYDLLRARLIDPA